MVEGRFYLWTLGHHGSYISHLGIISLSYNQFIIILFFNVPVLLCFYFHLSSEYEKSIDFFGAPIVLNHATNGLRMWTTPNTQTTFLFGPKKCGSVMTMKGGKKSNSTQFSILNGRSLTLQVRI